MHVLVCMYVLYSDIVWSMVSFVVLYGYSSVLVFFFQAEDGIRDLVRSRGLGDVYKRQIGILPTL